jgi:hypothetical protein
MNGKPGRDHFPHGLREHVTASEHSAELSKIGTPAPQLNSHEKELGLPRHSKSSAFGRSQSGIVKSIFQGVFRRFQYRQSQLFRLSPAIVDLALNITLTDILIYIDIGLPNPNSLLLYLYYLI